MQKPKLCIYVNVKENYVIRILYNNTEVWL